MKYIETNIGKIPLDSYLDIRASQCGFDDYKEMKEAGYSIDIDEESVINSDEIDLES